MLKKKLSFLLTILVLVYGSERLRWWYQYPGE